MNKGFLLVALAGLSGCAASQGGMLEQDVLQTFHSPKAPGVVAGCLQQSLRNGLTMGTDGTNFWVTRQNAWGTVVRYDMKPVASGGGTRVEYRSRLKVNNGLDKMKTCL